jgi:hypothetical protein
MSYEALGRFFARVERLTDGELLALIAAADPDVRVIRRDAMRTAETAAKEAGLARQLDQIRDRIVAWAIDRGPATGHLPGLAMGETLEGDLRRRAAPELIGAAFAIALGDQLPPESSHALLAAWGAAVGAELIDT